MKKKKTKQKDKREKRIQDVVEVVSSNNTFAIKEETNQIVVLMCVV
jgi:hypothetical protein